MERHLDPVEADLTHIATFLSEQAESGLCYRPVNNFRSAISAGHGPIDHRLAGMHPLIC